MCIVLGSIISGKKNSSLYQMDGSAGNLITYVSIEPLNFHYFLLSSMMTKDLIIHMFNRLGDCGTMDRR